MARKETNQSKDPDRLRLLVPKLEAGEKIKKQIDKGWEISRLISPFPQPFHADAYQDETKAQCNKWAAYNRELLKMLFSDNSIANGYTKLDTLLVAIASTPQDFRKRIEKDIGHLESILQRLELMPEALDVPQPEPDRVVEDKPSTEKWYQSRIIQAALISAVVLLFVSIVGWLIILYVNKYVNKLDGRSDVGTTISNEPEISGDSSPAITTTGPNSPSIVDYNTPGSKQLHAEPPPIIGRGEELIQPEEIEGDVNRPKISPIFKIPERTIAPEETAGEVNEPKKPELIKRKEKQIEPEDK